ncbi:Integrase [hydrothermal vent metagenome]|uniref:Integrase n=1 Tax=hydrothermal vent metagenome TaxID=652676 RepID=A0A1W1CCQ6_9ZZZZ
MGVKKGFVNSKRYGAKVKLYYPVDHAKSKDIIYYVTYKKSNGKKATPAVGKKSNGWTEKRAFEQRAKLIDEDKFGVGIHGNMITLGDLANKYFDFSKLHNRSWLKTEQKYNKHLSYLNDRSVMSLTEDDVVSLQKVLKDKDYFDRYNNDIVTILITIVNFGVKRGIIKYSPIRNIQKIKVDNTNNRFLKVEEVNKLLEASKKNKLFVNFIMIAINTGARAKAILLLKKSDINFDEMMLRLRNTKTNKSYNVPINKMFYDHFVDAEDGYLVGGSKKYTYSAFQPKIKKFLDEMFNKGMKPKQNGRVKLHTLRHSFATILSINNINTLQLKELLNHGDIKMTERYTHLNVESNRSAIDGLGDILNAKKLYSESE